MLLGTTWQCWSVSLWGIWLQSPGDLPTPVQPTLLPGGGIVSRIQGWRGKNAANEK